MGPTLEAGGAAVNPHQSRRYVRLVCELGGSRRKSATATATATAPIVAVAIAS
jgi:hypothetical protein